VVGICIPRRLVGIVSLISPTGPSLTFAAREELEVRPRAARLEDRVLFIRFAGMFSLATREVVHLRTTGLQGPSILTANTEQHKLGHIAKIKPDPRPSDPPSLRILCQTMLLLYCKPQLLITSIPNGSSAFGTHRYRWHVSLAALGKSQSS
jgi:hypothetical protein